MGHAWVRLLGRAEVPVPGSLQKQSGPASLPPLLVFLLCEGTAV